MMMLGMILFILGAIWLICYEIYIAVVQSTGYYYGDPQGISVLAIVLIVMIIAGIVLMVLDFLAAKSERKKGTMKRTRYAVQCNDNDMARNIVVDIMNREGFKETEFMGEHVWRKGTGLMTAMQFIKDEYMEGQVIISGWCKIGVGAFCGKDMDVKGFVAALPKGKLKTRLDTVAGAIYSQCFAQDGQYAPGMPQPMQGGVPDGQPVTNMQQQAQPMQQQQGGGQPAQPVQTPQQAQPMQPQQGGGQNWQPAQPVQNPQQAQPMQPQQGGGQNWQPAQPVQNPQQAQPMQPQQGGGQNWQPAQPVQNPQNARPMQPQQGGGQNWQPAQPVQNPQNAQPMQPQQSGGQNWQPAPNMQPPMQGGYQPAQPVQSPQPAQPMKPQQGGGQPVQPAQPVQPPQSASGMQQSAQPAEDVDPQK